MASAPTLTADDFPPQPADDSGGLSKLGAALPVALTAIATILAGLSTSEMTQAMFWRGAAAQDQAKATNQWTLAGFKRDRSLIVQTAAVQLTALAGLAGDIKPTFSPATLTDDADRLAAEWLAGQGPPKADLPALPDAEIGAILAAVRDRVPEADVLQMAGRVPVHEVNAAIDAAEMAVERINKEWDPTMKAAGKLAAVGTPATSARAALFELEHRRYRAEASLNQQVGYLYEARVKVLTAESERHKERSKNFFYAMLAAQLGATVASLGLARKQRSALWAIAGMAGMVAIGFGVYVYLGM